MAYYETKSFGNKRIDISQFSTEYLIDGFNWSVAIYLPPLNSRCSMVLHPNIQDDFCWFKLKLYLFYND